MTPTAFLAALSVLLAGGCCCCTQPVYYNMIQPPGLGYAPAYDTYDLGDYR